MTRKSPPHTQATAITAHDHEGAHCYVLDASALLAYLNGEPGAERVQQCIEHGQAIMSSVNLAEVLSKCADQGMSSADQAALCAALPLEITAFDTALALTSAALRSSTRAQGLSLGDRCCLALAQLRSATALTADQAWSRLGRSDIHVEQLRPPINPGSQRA
jgi:PIN domain nuclease of toxin-antitoxin system